MAFSYAPGEEAERLAEASRGLKTTSPVPSAAKSATAGGSTARPGIEINPISMDYVESAALKSKSAGVAIAGITEPVRHRSMLRNIPHNSDIGLQISSSAGAANGKAEGTRGYKRGRPGERGTASDESDDDDLEEYEEHKQPQTEEIMNAQLARVTFIHSLNFTQSKVV